MSPLDMICLFLICDSEDLFLFLGANKAGVGTDLGECGGIDVKIGSELPLCIDVVELEQGLVPKFVVIESTELRCFFFFLSLMSLMTSLLITSVRSSTLLKLLKLLRLLRLCKFPSPSAI